jgi:hypothetical protein
MKNLKGKDHSGDLCVSRRKVLKTDLTRKCVRGLHPAGQEWVPVASSYEHGNDPLASIKGTEFLPTEQLSASQERLFSMKSRSKMLLSSEIKRKQICNVLSGEINTVTCNKDTVNICNLLENK